MFSIFKKKYIDIFCYTDNINAYEYFPVQKARNFLPLWWKDIPNEVHTDDCFFKTKSSLLRTMKRCPGIIEFYKKGLIIPLWTDIEFIINNDINEGCISSAADGTELHSHPEFQKGAFLPENMWIHKKIISPWYFETKTNEDFLVLQPHWNLNNLNADIVIPNGYSNFYNRNSSTNVQVFAKKEINKVINLNAGLPIAHIVPLSDKQLRIHTSYDPDRIDLLNKKAAGYSFTSFYYRKKIDGLHNNL